MENKTPNYIVWDVEEVASVCSPEEMQMLNNVIDKVLQARSQHGLTNNVQYLVIPNSKPYYRPIAEMLGLIQASNNQGYMRGYNDAN
ncbi:hypothetical protein JBP901_gp084 [Bacillus phage JBP901]|uniref:Uncharacterized protein n=2 Tax=Caeruleovirus TaxID=1911929 RepID=A0A0E3DF36_9CAUD|nr:hypothetical protein JBP901_gp084 [Bacillus phage JBP901]YP_009149684.1 hypothetical protein BCP8-2_123 [Bacillus phage BCP8-2]AHJ87161.1 hypothetical protein BCP8-2_123 [Bacillus phage BCP8-2]AID17796.1 hypothetical protein JBP901_gp084 [Bacillus phage JBP901]